MVPRRGAAWHARRCDSGIRVTATDLGQRVWRRYQFDLTPHARAGGNLLAVTVANSDANWQAQGDPIYPYGSWGMRIKTERERLQSVDRNGLIGPVTVTSERRE